MKPESKKGAPPAAYTVNEFCRAYRFCRAHFYNLLSRNEGPRFFKAGKRTLISTAAAEEWRAAAEQRAQQAT